jgi:hypothetical protein
MLRIQVAANGLQSVTVGNNLAKVGEGCNFVLITIPYNSLAMEVGQNKITYCICVLNNF